MNASGSRTGGISALIRSNLANVLEKAKRYDEAIAQFRGAIRCRPKDPTKPCNPGYALFQTEKLDAAIEEFQKALQIDPNFTQAQQDLDAAIKKRDEKK